MQKSDWSKPIEVFLFLSTLFLLYGITAAQAPKWTPPPEPEIKPFVSAPLEVDKDKSKVDDLLETRIKSAMATLAKVSTTAEEQKAAQDILNSTVRVELIFSKQITQEQIDAFLKAGGAIEHIFSHISYGWTGIIPLKQVTGLVNSMGNSLLGIVEAKKVTKHMDQAGRSGRVRPYVWNKGFDGDRTTTSNKITIAILDTGIDGTHTDLSTRQEYWKDWTSDNLSTAKDVGHHGTHVAGIALGTGFSSGTAPTTISYTDLGTFPSTAGYFSPSPIHVPTAVSSINWTSNMRWDTTYTNISARLGHLNSDTSGSWGSVGTLIQSSTSPLNKTSNGLANPYPNRTNRWSSYGTKAAGSGPGTPEYAITNTISYTGIGDGYYTFRGVAPDCQWAGLKVFMNDGSGIDTDINEALDDLVSQRTTHLIKVANLSLGVIGDPGISVTQRNKINTAVSNGVVVVISAGNDGDVSSGGAGEIDDPGRAQYAITVAAANDINQLTAYSSHGFNSPGDGNSGDEDMKPDITAPGGSTEYSNIFAPDSNTSDSEDTTGINFTDAVANDYTNFMGTSMAAPYISGCAALVIDAWQQSGQSWHYTGAEALNDVLRVKMFLLMTATETNTTREPGGYSGDPSLNRGTKDIHEGFGMVNADAAVDAAYGYNYSPSSAASGSFSSDYYGQRCWARKVNLYSAATIKFNLDVPPTGDFDIYLYSSTPDSYGNPQILSSSTGAGLDTDESISYVPVSTGSAYVVIKRVSGSGTWNMNMTSVTDWVLM
jgi:subtilisin family serine protease